MRLIIENSYNEDLKSFINDIIIPACSQILYSIIDRKYLKHFDTYLSNKYKTNISSDHIIRIALKNLIIYNHQDNYQITINPNIFVPGINAKLYDLCALINYGNMEIHPYPIFDKAMEKLSSFVPMLYRKYKFGE